MSPKRKIIFSISLILLLGMVFSAGFYFGGYKKVCEVCPPSSVDFSLFWESWKVLEEKFVDKTKFDVQKMIYGAISGMVESLDDPYTVFMSPQESKKFTEDVRGSFGGIGIEIDIKKDQLVVVSPLEGTPAQKAGFKSGDKILAINGTSTFGITVDEAVKMIRGDKGTEVTLTMDREGWDKPKDIKIIRDIIKVPSLKLEFKDDNICYLKLYQFSEEADFDFSGAANDILNSQCQRIVLDLRDNPGGYLEVSKDIAGWFLERNEVVTIEHFGDGSKDKEYRSLGPSVFLEYPIVVLINGGSASASEILAGALRDNRSILLIGEKSFGKGSVQEMEELSGGSSLKITVAKWLTPKGESISEKGLEPDIKVEMTEEDYINDKDPQLDKAIEVIKGIR